MTTISIKENTTLPFLEFNNFLEAANKLLELSGYVLIYETDINTLPQNVQTDYLQHQKNKPENYLDI